MSRCGDCEEKLGQKAIQGDCVVCAKCNAKYHYDKCSGVAANTWQTMGERKREQWKCLRCRKPRTESEKEREEQIDLTKEKEEDEINSEENRGNGMSDETEGSSRMERRMIRMESKIDQLIGNYNEIKAKLDTIEFLTKEQEDLKKENEALKTRMTTLEDRMQTLENKEVKYKKIEQTIETMSNTSREKEQYDRNRNLEIGQLDWMENEKLPEVIQRVAENFNVQNFRQEQIETAHRIPNRDKDKPSVLIIQFKHRESRNQWLEQKKRIVTNDNIYRNGNRRRVYLNENMTPYYKNLFWKTKNYARSNNIKYVWFKNGKIMMRRSELDKEVRVVRNDEDLNSASSST